MSERNKELVRRVIEQVVNRGNLTLADELIATDYVYHEPTAGEKRGRDGFRRLVITYRTVFRTCGSRWASRLPKVTWW